MLFSFYLKDQYLGRRPIPMGTRPAPRVCAVAKVLFHFDGQVYRCEDELTAEKLVTKRNKYGVPTKTWEQIRDRNESLDTFVLALAALRIVAPNAQRFAKLAAQIAAVRSTTSPPVGEESETPSEADSSQTAPSGGRRAVRSKYLGR